MELNDAYKILAISDKERAFVQNYLGCKYTRLNLVLDLEPYTVASLEKEGSASYDDVQSLLDDIDNFSILYAAMVKTENDVAGVLYRKSSEDECKFLGCVHVNEPVCGVKEALKEGKISQSRYDNYKLLYEELKENEKRKYS